VGKRSRSIICRTERPSFARQPRRSPAPAWAVRKRAKLWRTDLFRSNVARPHLSVMVFGTISDELMSVEV